MTSCAAQVIPIAHLGSCHLILGCVIILVPNKFFGIVASNVLGSGELNSVFVEKLLKDCMTGHVIFDQSDFTFGCLVVKFSLPAITTLTAVKN